MPRSRLEERLRRLIALKSSSVRSRPSRGPSRLMDRLRVGPSRLELRFFRRRSAVSLVSSVTGNPFLSNVTMGSEDLVRSTDRPRRPRSVLLSRLVLLFLLSLLLSPLLSPFLRPRRTSRRSMSSTDPSSSSGFRSRLLDRDRDDVDPLGLSRLLERDLDFFFSSSPMLLDV